MMARIVLLLTAMILPLQALPATTDNAASVAAEARAERPQLRERFPAAFAAVTDDPHLPRVLLIGDSISIGYTPSVRELLHGVANVHRIPDNGGPTIRGRVMLDEWLGDGRWDVIHFSFGLHDIRRDTGKPRASVTEYEQNLRAIIARLRQTGARLVFATTTPVPAGGTQHPERHSDDVPLYNAAALKVVSELGIPADDLYAAALPRLSSIQLPANVHYTEAGYRELATPVAESIRAQLPQPRRARP